MHLKRFPVGPLFDENHALGIFYIAVNGVRNASRLPARPVDVLKGEREHLIESFRPRDNAASDKDHWSFIICRAVSLPKNAVKQKETGRWRPFRSQGEVLPMLYFDLAPALNLKVVGHGENS